MLVRATRDGLAVDTQVLGARFHETANAEIARALGTSVNTVRNQLRGLFRKLGASTRAEAIALSLGHGDR